MRHRMKAVAIEEQVLGAAHVQPGKAGVHPLGAVDGAQNAAELVARYGDPVQEMPGAIGLDHDIAEPRRDIAGQEDDPLEGRQTPE